MVAATTRQRAIDTALTLFNADAAATVSMSRLAAACGISRSNLEYHFPSKRDLIRALFGSIVTEINGWYQDHLRPTHSHMAVMYARHSLLVYRYRFFYRELPKPLHDDAVLLRLPRESMPPLRSRRSFFQGIGEAQRLAIEARRAAAALAARKHLGVV
jgi:AcrR family transcriptional regulator